MELNELANKLSDEKDADILLFNGEIRSPSEYVVRKICSKMKSKKNVILFLCTFGGSPDVAYRIASCLQDNYENFSINIHGYCKSAGTLIALGANEIVMSDSGELGPLDVQLAKEDELIGSNSGLNINETLDKLNEKSLESLEKYFIPIIEKSGGRISTKTAIQIASNLVIGLYGKIYEHIDPFQFGEINRALKIAIDYGKKLNQRFDNLQDATLKRLTTDYSNHGFVIDRKEAKILFKNVRDADTKELQLVEAIGEYASVPTGDEKGNPFICKLNQKILDKKEGEKNGNDPGKKDPSKTDKGKTRRDIEEK